MKIERGVCSSPKFRPYSISVVFEEANDEQLFLSMLKKLESEIHPGGIYHGIVKGLRKAMGVSYC